jgi:hypothetical protein
MVTLGSGLFMWDIAYSNQKFESFWANYSDRH